MPNASKPDLDPGPSPSPSPSLAEPAPEEVAEDAGLHYVDDRQPGFSRRRQGTGWSYKDTAGETIRNPEVRRRIEALAIPPAWDDVWICPTPRGHLQATGRDDAGRKQYRYHEEWTEVRNRTKFHRLLPFAHALPAIRAEVDHQLRRPQLDRDKVLGIVTRLLEASCIRVGNEEYRKQNRSYGLTTLRQRHVDVNTTSVRFSFRGKSGQKHEVAVSDRRLARAVGRCQELPGHELFQYVDEDGQRHGIDSADVNDFLRRVTGEPFTAKDFRTWMGSVHALDHLWAAGPAEDQVAAAAQALAAIDHAAAELANTREVSRSFYVHPAILEGYEEGWLFDVVGRRPPQRPPEWLEAEEAGLLALLEHVADD